jgi:glycosyltransferase involved in cell wall biosynthesis
MSQPFDINSVCIIVASHISNPKRIKYLIECLESLLSQTISISIYVSISFATTEIREQFAIAFSENKHLHNSMINIIVKTQKTPQMRHMEQLLELLKTKHEWVMFCDDDDTYHKERVQTYIHTIVHSLHEIIGYPNKKLAGVYENEEGINHRERRREYWCYCVRYDLLERFIHILLPYPDILDNKCCDVLFAEYLRRLNDEYVYAILPTTLYNYREDNNDDSVTGVIKVSSRTIRKPREVTAENVHECAKELDEYLDKEIDIYLHDIYLRTIVGSDFNTIMKSEFMSEYPLLNIVKKEHIETMWLFHSHLRTVINEMYDIKV